MNGSERNKVPFFRERRFFWIIAGIWTMIITAALGWSVVRIKHGALDFARTKARAAYDKDRIFRQWNAEHGEVYVPVTKETPPNPYLSGVPERDITTPSGKLLTLINPAYMTRQVYELAKKEHGVSGHLTSLKPINPQNAPDPWEAEALRAFERGETEISSVEKLGGKDYLRLMRPLFVEKSCLQCHAQQGYRQEDLRGGISVSIPMEPLRVIERGHLMSDALLHGLLWLVGLAGTYWATQRLKKSERIRKRKDEERETILRTAMDGFWVMDTQGRFLEVNEAYRRMTGYSRDELLTMRVQDVEAMETTEESAQRIRRVMEVGRDQFETRHRCKDGRIVDIEVSANYTAGSGGRFFVFLRDITERKRAEGALRSALEESRQGQREIAGLLAASQAVLKYSEFPDAARAIFDSCRSLIGASGGYIALLSKDREQNEVLFLESGSLPCTVDPSLAMPIRGLREEAYRNGKPVYHNDFSNSEWQRFIPDGHIVLKNILFAPIRIEGKVVGLLGLGNKPDDFTQNDARLAAAMGEFTAIALLNSWTLKSLEKSEERFRSVLQSASDAVIASDSRGNIIISNQAVETFFGYRPDEVLGKPITLLIPERLDEAHQNGGKRLLSTGKPDLIQKTVEGMGLRKDGTKFPAEISLAAWGTGEEIFFTSIVRDITERKRAKEELQTANTELERRVAERTAELHANNEFLQEEIIRRKQAEQALLKAYDELKQTQAHLIQAEKAEVITRLASAVAHEVKNPLAVIVQGIDYLSANVPPGNENISLAMGHILDAAQRADKIIRGLMDFSRASEIKMTPEDLNSIVKSSLLFAKNQFDKHRIEVREELGEDIVLINLDKNRIEQVLLNLFLNAVDAMPEGGQIKVRTYKEEAGSGETAVVAEIEDTGSGIPEDILDKIMDPFFTTKRGKGGTGLGLSVVKNIVGMHGGEIKIDNRKDRSGVKVTLMFKARNEEA